MPRKYTRTCDTTVRKHFIQVFVDTHNTFEDVNGYELHQNVSNNIETRHAIYRVRTYENCRANVILTCETMLCKHVKSYRSILREMRDFMLGNILQTYEKMSYKQTRTLHAILSERMRT